MRIVALLSWYDEDPAWLKRCVESLALIPVDRLLAADGAYDLFPGRAPKSDEAQHEAIRRAAAQIDLQVTITVPLKVWDTEIEKRTWMFQHAEAFTSDQDWYMVIDSDEFVTKAPTFLHTALHHSPMDVGAVDLIEPGHPRGTIHFPTFPMFFRAIRGLEVVGEHFCYRTPEGRYLWGDATRQRLEPRVMTGVTVEHHNQLRNADRRRAAQAYYEARDKAGIEGLKAERYLTKTA